MWWLIFAILSAVFAAATSILAKIGIEGVNSNLATAIRTVVYAKDNNRLHTDCGRNSFDGDLRVRHDYFF